jgi:hypothetical protein
MPWKKGDENEVQCFGSARQATRKKIGHFGDKSSAK